MFEGHDTTAMGMLSTLHLIQLHDYIQDKVHYELDEIFANNKTRQMKYIENCTKESMRLDPLVSVIGRICTDNFQLESYTMSKGTQINMIIYELIKMLNHFQILSNLILTDLNVIK